MTIITSSNYWTVVFQELQEAINENSHIKYLYIAKKYDEAIKLIEDKIIAWYGRNSINHKVSLKQAYKKLPPDQLEQFHDLIATYLRDWREELGYDLGGKTIDHASNVSKKDTDAQELEQLTTETNTINDTDTWLALLQEYQTKDDVTCFEALSIPILNEIEKVSNDTSNTLLELLVITGWVVYSDINKTLKIQGLAQEQLKKELLKSWAKDDLNLYDRFNSNKAKLSASVKSTLVKGFRNEMSVDDVIAEVSKTMGIGAGAAKRLVVTENSFFNTQSTYLALKQAGYTHYRYICRLLPTSCEDCIDLHSTVFPMDAYEVGVTSPPLHPHCLCYIVGEFSEVIE